MSGNKRSERGDTLHVYIKPENKDFLAKIAKEKGLSLSLHADQVIEKLRLKHEVSKKK